MGRSAVCEFRATEETYKGFDLVEFEDRLYGVPTDLVRFDLSDPVDQDRLFRHPAVVWAPTRDTLLPLLDDFDPRPYRQEPLGTFEDCRLVRFQDRVYGIPLALGHVDLNLEEDRTLNGVVSGETVEEVRQRILADRSATPVEFAGWLPVFRLFGNCGAHPQFAHTQHPPSGYKFIRSKPTRAPDYELPARAPNRRSPLYWAGRCLVAVALACRGLAGFTVCLWKFGPARCLATLVAFFRLVLLQVRKGGNVRLAIRFARSRHFRSQAQVPRGSGLLFLTSVPYTYGQKPWVIEIEDPTSLFYPFLGNGATFGEGIERSPYVPLVRALLEADNCRGIITHMRSTAEALPVMLGSDVVRRKITYAPLGVELPKLSPRRDEDDHINLLFTNSWHQGSRNFSLRGGLDVLEAFAILHERYPQLRLTMRTALPGRMAQRHIRIIERCWVRLIQRFLPDEDMEEIQRRSHIYLLPAARIHIVSVLQAMSYGQAVVVSDGWGMDEYVTHERNGLVVKGRYGKVSWMDRRTGWLREDYRSMFAPDPVVVEGLVEAVSRLVEDRRLRLRLGRTARADVETKYTLQQWNASLKAAFDRARGVV
jgi:glycosyltransferase involved in cell wall biosynthesis